MDNALKQLMREHGFSGRFWLEMSATERDQVRAEAARLALKAGTEEDREWWRFIRKRLK